MEELEERIARLIEENATIGYTFRDGRIDPFTVFIHARGAAHVVLHELKRRNLLVSVA